MHDVHRPPTPGDLAAEVRRLREQLRRLSMPLGRLPHTTVDPVGVDAWIRDDTGQLCYRDAAGTIHRLGP